MGLAAHRFALGIALLLGAAVSGCGPSVRPKAQRLPMELLNKHPRRSRQVKTTGSLVGVVLGADGKPVDFALVAAVNVADDPESGKPPRLTTSLDRGKFTIEDLPPGNYGLTVTSPEANLTASPPLPGQSQVVAIGTFAGVVSVTAGDAGPPMLVRLGTQGVLFQGHVTDDKGAPISGALVRAVRESPFEGDHFFAKSALDGKFTLAVPAGSYFLVGQAEGRQPERLSVDVQKLPPDIPIKLAPALALPTKEEVESWVSTSGGAIESLDRGAPAKDLARLRDVVGAARIVGLGDASYSGGEIWKIRARMTRFLVEEMGFSLVLLEVTQADARALDDYVLHGKGNLADLLPSLGYFADDTEELASLLAWMKGYNEDRKHRVKLRVAGIDVQRTALAASELSRFLAKVDKAFLPQVETTLDRMRVNDFGVDLRKRPADEQDKVAADLDSIVEQLRKKDRLYAARSSAQAWAIAEEDALSLRWAAKVYRDESQRGAAMADLARRTIDGLSPKIPPKKGPAKVGTVLFAHDVFISKRKSDGGTGALLAEAYGTGYLAIGSTFYQGWIRAWDFTTGPTMARGTKLFRLPPSDPGTLESALDVAGTPMYFADVRAAKGGLLPWMEARVSMRSAGSVFESDRRARTRVVVKDAFDALIFVRKQTTVHYNETGKRLGQREWE